MLVAVDPVASVTLTCTLKVPVIVGRPHNSRSPGAIHESVAAGENRLDIPGGRPVAVHVNGAVPPLTFTPRLHGTPMVQSSMNEPYGLTDGNAAGTATTAIDMLLVYELLLLSRAVTWMLNLPRPLDTVPKITPVFGSMLSPFGRLFALNLYPPAPPLAAIVVLYAPFCVVFGSTPSVVMFTAYIWKLTPVSTVSTPSVMLKFTWADPAGGVMKASSPLELRLSPAGCVLVAVHNTAAALPCTCSW